MNLIKSRTGFRRCAVLAGLAVLATPLYAQTNIWTGPNAGNWSTPANWSLGLPGPGQTLSLAVDTTLSSGTYTANALSYTAGTWSLLGGSLTLTGGPNNIQNFFWNGGTLSGGSISVNNFAQLTSGTLGMESSLVLNGPTTMNSSSFTLGDEASLSFQGSVNLGGNILLGTDAMITTWDNGVSIGELTTNGGTIRFFDNYNANGFNSTFNSKVTFGGETTFTNGGATLKLFDGATLNGDINSAAGTISLESGNLLQDDDSTVTANFFKVATGTVATSNGTMTVTNATVDGVLNVNPLAAWGSTSSLVIGQTGRLNSYGTATRSTGTLDLDGILYTDGVFNATGAFNWNNGSIRGEGNFNMLGLSYLNNGTTKDIIGVDSTVTNSGTLRHNAGSLRLLGTTSFINSGSYHVNGEFVYISGPTSNVFFQNNSFELINTDENDRHAYINATFQNNGTIELNAGTITFQDILQNYGTIQSTDDGSMLRFNGASTIFGGTLSVPNLSIGGTATFQSGANYTGLHNITIESGGNLFVQPGANLGSLGSVRNSGLLQNNGGPASISNLEIDKDSSFDAPSVFNSTSNTTVGNLDWSNGEFTGNSITTVNGSTSINASDAPLGSYINGHAMVLNGNTDHIAGDINFLGAPSILRNNSTYTITGAGIDFNGSTVHQIKNFGTFRKNGASDISRVFVQLDNAAGGVVDVQTGTLRLLGGGTGAGSFTVSPGANIDFNLGLYNFLPGASFNGDQVITTGQVTIGNGVTWNGNTVINGGFMAYQTGATYGPGSLSVQGAGQLRVQGGTMNQVGAFTNFLPGPKSLNNGNFIISSNAKFRFANSGIETNNSNVWLLGDGAALQNLSGNNALFTLSQNNGILSLGSLLLDLGVNLPIEDDLGNSGTLAVDAGSSIIIGGRYTQFSGQTIINGSMIATEGIFLEGGEFGGTGTVDGGLNNGGSLSPGSSPGTLVINGAYTQASGGSLNMEIQSQSVYDKLVVNGTGQLGGKFNARFLDGANPQLGQMFDLLTFSGGYTGRFGQVTTFGSPNFVIDLNYDSTTVIRGMVRAVPEPATMLALGGALLGLGLRRRKKAA